MILKIRIQPFLSSVHSSISKNFKIFFKLGHKNYLLTKKIVSSLGIENRLIHLADFNGSIWLSPIYESPMIDFGYDISNFTKIDPIFGTTEDLRSLITKVDNK